MQHIPKSAARRIPVAPEFTILEYGPLGDGVANGTVAEVAEVSGRYPQRGWGMNRVCDEIVYVVSGSGRLETPESATPLAPGDVAYVPKGQKIAWHGEHLVIFIPCVPAWTPEQHELFEE
jgi:mannose-6-phosphate isomerase-like protein (cupin superfamily)